MNHEIDKNKLLDGNIREKEDIESQLLKISPELAEERNRFKKLTTNILDINKNNIKENDHIPIWIVDDFSGVVVGEDSTGQTIDCQTTVELTRAMYQLGYTSDILIDDNAPSLSPRNAYNYLDSIKELQYTNIPTQDKNRIKQIVVHVIDPGVGNNQEKKSHELSHKRVFVERKDGTLFIGPDNGTLTKVCPPGSIHEVYEIDPQKIDTLSGADTASGGTFHGRDLFGNGAALVGQGIDYKELSKKRLDDISRFDTIEENSFTQQSIGDTAKKYSTDHTSLKEYSEYTDTNNLGKSYLISASTAPIYYDKIENPNGPLIVRNQYHLIDAREEESTNDIVIINYKTKQICFAPDNGVAYSVIAGYEREEFSVYKYSKVQKIIQKFQQEKKYSPEKLAKILSSYNQDNNIETINLDNPIVKTINNSMSGSGITLDDKGRISSIDFKVFHVDLYGNLKLLLDYSLLHSAKKQGAKNIKIEINGQIINITEDGFDAKAFTDVEIGETLLYAGSSHALGKNPKRSKRLSELTLREDFDNDSTGRTQQQRFGKGLLLANGIPEEIIKPGLDMRLHFQY